MLRHILTLLFILAALPALSAEDPKIRELMTDEEFAASGLGRLSNEEIEVINRWLVRYTAQDAPQLINSSPAVKELNRASVMSRIDGEFNGWNGPTRFVLKNGHVYETNSTRRYEYFAIDPEVEITTNWMGIQKMHILETGKAINVRRVE